MRKGIIFLLSFLVAQSMCEQSSFSAKSMGSVLDIAGEKSEVKNIRGEKTLPLKEKDTLELHDVVVTGYSSTAALELSEKDKTGKVHFLVYENSKFKVEPVIFKNGKRSIVARLTSGLVRYITDGLGKEETVTIETPKATIGIRGSEGEVLYLPSDVVANLGFPEKKILLAQQSPVMRLTLNDALEVSVVKGTANVRTADFHKIIVSGEQITMSPLGISIRTAAATAQVAAAYGAEKVTVQPKDGATDVTTASAEESTVGTETQTGGTTGCKHSNFVTDDGGGTSYLVETPCGSCPPNTNCASLPANELQHNAQQGCC